MTVTTDFFFVYGTLKEGGHFSKQFDAVRVASEPAELKGFDLFNLGWFPGIMPGDGTVIGEVHEYTDAEAVRARMDRIEGFNPDRPESSLYLRKRVDVKAKSGKVITANAYVFNKGNPSDAKKIESGIWELGKAAT